MVSIELWMKDRMDLSILNESVLFMTFNIKELIQKIV